MIFGSCVPRPYHAKRVKSVVRAKRIEKLSHGTPRIVRKPAFSCEGIVESRVVEVSGRTLKAMTMTTKEIAVTQNIERQPRAGMSQMPVSAAIVPPRGTPDIIRVAIDRATSAG